MIENAKEAPAPTCAEVIEALNALRNSGQIHFIATTLSGVVGRAVHMLEAQRKQLEVLRDANAVLQHRIQDLEGRCVPLNQLTEMAFEADQGLRDRNALLEGHCKVLTAQLEQKNIAQMINNAWNKEAVEPATPRRESALGVQVGGGHYKKLGAYQPWEVAFAQYTPEEFKGAMKLTVQSYLAREADKGGMDDIRKAAHTLQIYLELEGRRNAVQGLTAAPERD